MIPVYRIDANDKDITQAIQGHLASFRITDAKGYESDSFEMVLTDPNAEILWPTAEVRLKVWIGFVGEPLVYKGEYVTDEVSFDGPPDKFIIKARAADMNGAMKAQKSRSWHRESSLGAIIEYIAAGNNLKPAIAERFYQIKIPHIDQTNESDFNFITRLAKRYDAIAKVANGSLIFAVNGDGKTASGDDMPSFDLYRHQTSDYSFSYCGKSEFTGVAALWHDVKTAELKKSEFKYIPLGTERHTFKNDTDRYAYQKAQWDKKQLDKAKNAEERDALKDQQRQEDQALVGKEGNVKTLKRHFASEAEAKNAAEAEFKRLARDKDTANISVKMGKPAFAAECKFELIGWRSDIDTHWVSKEVSFDYSASGGLTTNLQLEKAQSSDTG